MRRNTGLLTMTLSVGLITSGCTHTPDRYCDFTHKIPLFAPTAGDITKPDLAKPFKDSKAVASFGFQAIRKVKDPFKTQKGFFQWGWFHFDEHYTIHLDSTDHYLNSDTS
jgi:hypothetical protein